MGEFYHARPLEPRSACYRSSRAETTPALGALYHRPQPRCLTPFFFVKGGLSVSLSAVWANIGVLGLLVVAKILPKFAGVYPLARRYTKPHAVFTTLLMSTGLTFGTITSLYGLQAAIIDRA